MTNDLYLMYYRSMVNNSIIMHFIKFEFDCFIVIVNEITSYFISSDFLS
jgi:hypothetical protein